MAEQISGNAGSADRNGRRKILVVGREDFFTEAIMEYAIHLAGRLGYDLLAASVGTAWGGRFPSMHQSRLREGFVKRAGEAGETLKLRAAEAEIHCEHVIKFGSLGKTVGELIREHKRIEFVVTESEANKGEVTQEVTIPVFSVVPNYWNDEGGKIMANQVGAQKAKPWGSTIGFGVLTVAFYAAVFGNADAVTNYFTRGGWYAALPIATVFAFSFLHGAFASNLWSLLGIEAKKRETDRVADKKVVSDVKRARKRPRAYAHINPFHRM